MGIFSTITFKYPDRFLSIMGGAGGFTFGMGMTGDITGSLALGLVFALYTLIIANVQTE